MTIMIGAGINGAPGGWTEMTLRHELQDRAVLCEGRISCSAGFRSSSTPLPNLPIIVSSSADSFFPYPPPPAKDQEKTRQAGKKHYPVITKMYQDITGTNYRLQQYPNSRT